jgi:Zn-finger protein
MVQLKNCRMYCPFYQRRRNKKNETIQTLGFPIWNTGAIILNKSLEKVPNNVIGELFIYGKIESRLFKRYRIKYTMFLYD